MNKKGGVFGPRRNVHQHFFKVFVRFFFCFCPFQDFQDQRGGICVFQHLSKRQGNKKKTTVTVEIAQTVATQPEQLHYSNNLSKKCHKVLHSLSSHISPPLPFTHTEQNKTFAPFPLFPLLHYPAPFYSGSSFLHSNCLSPIVAVRHFFSKMTRLQQRLGSILSLPFFL